MAALDAGGHASYLRLLRRPTNSAHLSACDVDNFQQSSGGQQGAGLQGTSPRASASAATQTLEAPLIYLCCGGITVELPLR